MRVKRLSLIINVIIVLSSASAITMDFSPSAVRIMDGNPLLFFTTQSNIAVGAVSMCSVIMYAFDFVAKKWMSIIKLATTTSIMLTMAVYCFLLAPAASGIYEGVWSTCNVLLHVVVPLMCVLDYYLTTGRQNFCVCERLWTIVPPVLFMTFSAIGYVSNWNYGLDQNYPYFFMNYASEAGVFGFCGQLPYIGVFYYAVAIAAAVYLFGVLLTIGAKRGKNAIICVDNNG